MIEKAAEIARKGIGDKKYSFGCVITDKRGRILSTGTNSYSKTHRRQAELAKEVGSPDRIWLHSELHAMLSCRHEGGTDLYVTRMNKNGELKMARPCSVCWRGMEVFGIERVHYTTDSGDIVTEEL